MIYNRRKLVNLTPHMVNIFTNEGDELFIPPSGIVARRACEEEVIGDFGGISVAMRTYEHIVYMRNKLEIKDFVIDPEKLYIVSRICLAGRDTPINFFAPGALVGQDGVNKGGKGLVRVKYLT